MELLFILLDPSEIFQTILTQNNTTVISIFRNDFSLEISFWDHSRLWSPEFLKFRGSLRRTRQSQNQKWVLKCNQKIAFKVENVNYIRMWGQDYAQFGFQAVFCQSADFSHWIWNQLKTIKSSFVIILFYFICDILQIIQKVFNFIMW